MKWIQFIFWFLFIFLIHCKDDSISAFPQIETREVADITESGATFSCTIHSRGSTPLIRYGFVWSAGNPSLTNGEHVVFDGSELSGNSFDARITRALEENQTYRVRAFYEDESNLIYGNTVSFTSLGSEGPMITSVTPSLVAFGDSLFIRGTNFSTQANEVHLGSRATAPVFNSDTLVIARIPTSFKFDSFVVSLSVLGTASTFADSIRLKPPVLDRLVPEATVYGDTIHIEGQFFGPSISLNEVFLNDSISTTILSATSTEVAFTLSVAQEPIKVSLVNSAGQKSSISALSILEPAISEVSPVSGLSETAVNLTGTNFGYLQDEAQVFFNDQEAFINSFDNEKIEVIVPTGIGNPVEIQLRRFEETMVTADFYYAGPEVMSYAPISGTWGSVVTIQGQNFSENISDINVLVGGLLAEVTNAQENEITFLIPDNVSDSSVELELIVNSERVDFGHFAMNDAEISSIIPALVTNIGEQVTIQGRNFHPVSSNNTVTLDDTPLQIVSSNQEEIQVIITESQLENELVSTFKNQLSVSNTISSVSSTSFEFEYETAWKERENFDFSVLVVDDSFIIGNKGYVVLRDRRLFEYSFDNDTWVQKSSFPGFGGTNNRRWLGTAFAINGYGYYGLGVVKCISPSNPNLVCSDPQNDLWRYSPTSDSWVQLNNAPLEGHYNYTAIANNDVYLMSLRGDNDGTFLYDHINDAWTEKAIITTNTDHRSSTLRSFIHNNDLCALYQTFDDTYIFKRYDESIDLWNTYHTESSFQHIYDVNVIGDHIYLTDYNFISSNEYTSRWYILNNVSLEKTVFETPTNTDAVIPFIHNGLIYMDGLSPTNKFYVYDPNF